jgi:DNA polymerase elongation subunit (family B)
MNLIQNYNSILRGLNQPCLENWGNLSLQIVDWKTCDKEINEDTSSIDEDDLEGDKELEYNFEYLITLFGITSDNKSICVDVHGFKPYFYIKVPPKWDKNAAKKFIEGIKSKFTGNLKKFRSSILEFKLLKKMIFKGFSNNQKHKFIKIIFKNKKCMMLINYLIKNNNEAIKEIAKKKQDKKKIVDENRKKELTKEMLNLNKKIIKIPFLISDGGTFEIFESNIDPMLRFIHENNIKPCGWITIDKNKYSIFDVDENVTNCQVHIKTEYKYVKEQEKDDVNKIIIASYDIECDSSHGDFPLAQKDYKKLAANIFDQYHNRKRKIQKNKDLSKEAGYKNLENIEVFSKDIIDMSFKDEENIFDIEYTFTKKNKKPKKENINKIFTNYFCPHCNNLLLIPGEKNINDSKLESKVDYDKINFDGKFGIVNDTINMSLKNKDKKKFDWDNIKLSCNALIDEKRNKRCNHVIGSMKTKREDDNEKIYMSLSLENLSYFEKLVKIPHSSSTPRDETVKSMASIMNHYLPEIEGDKVIQIGTAVQIYGEKSCFLKHIITLGSCDPIDGVVVESYDNERDVLLAWTRFIQVLDPDFITGYNIFGFDYHFMWQRAQELNCLDQFSCLGRLHEEKSELIDKTLSSAGLGDNILKYIHMDGRIQMDLLKIIQRDHKLDSYKLDSVSSNFINGAVKNYIVNDNNTIIESDNIIGLVENNYITLYFNNVNGIEKYNEGEKLKVIQIMKEDKKFIIEKEIFLKSEEKYMWGLAKDDVGPKDIFELQKKGPSERAIIAKYCVQDCELCINLCNKLDIVTNNIGMANVCNVPLSFIFLRGQGIKIFSLVSKQCREEKYLIPISEIKDVENREGYEGAIVLKPKPGIYLDEPVAVLDYASLYPSSMISENLSHETICIDKKWLGEDGAKELEKLGLTYRDITYDNYKYVAKGKSFVKVINSKKPTVTCRFVQPQTKNGEIIEETRAVIPRILRKLLGARKATRKKIPLEKDPFKKSVLDGLQLAYKVTANSLYGSIGASTSQVAFKEIAASTTATGRKLINLAKDFIEENYEDSDTVYGDTDSVFINFKPKDKEGNRLFGYEALKESIRLGTEAGIKISKLLDHPHDLEYEKTFWPFVLLSKKRYVGNKYEEDPNKFKQTSMGIVLKRRDNAQIVKYIYGGIIDIIMNQRDIKKSIDFLKTSLQELLDGKFPMDKLIITKSLKAYYKDPERIAHKVLADRIGRRDPGNKPQPNDRIPYVYIQHKAKKDDIILQGDKIETPQFIIDNKIPIDYIFYITNQIMKPVCQIYTLILEELEGFKYDKNYYKNMQSRLMFLCKTVDEKKKVKEKIQNLKMKNVEEILFSDSLRQAENKKEGRQEITKWFSVQT